LYLAVKIGFRQVLLFLDGYFYWLGDFVQVAGKPDEFYQMITVLSLCVLMSVFSYIFIIAKFHFMVVFCAGMGLFTVQWSYDIFTGYLAFYCYLFVTLACYLKHVYQIKARKSPNEFVKTGMLTLWSIPVCVLIIGLSSLIHASDKPIEWKWLDQKIISAYKYFNRMDMESFDYFSLSASSGFGDRNGFLGGKVHLDKTNVLKVSTSRNVYLRGVSKELYNGAGWTNSSSRRDPAGADYASLLEDTEELQQGMRYLTGNQINLKQYFNENKVMVTFLNLKTKSVFLPSKMTSFSSNNKGLQTFVDSTGGLSAQKRMKKGFQYTVKMLSPKIGTQEFEDILRKSRKGLYSDYIIQNYRKYSLNQSAQPTAAGSASAAGSVVVRASSANFSAARAESTANSDEEKQSVIKLMFRSNKIYNSYLQLPVNLPQRVKDLAVSLTGNCENNYDKAKAIEKYLASKYPYNLDVRSTPRHRDFVDYFLFDLRQGYCSYYASAMAILARCAGLPARYVEGYILPPEPSKNDPSVYVVTNMQAHAWVEIYFEGYGWLPFEPTSPFRNHFYSDSSSEAVLATGYNPGYENYMEMMRRYSGKGRTRFLPADEKAGRKIPAWQVALPAAAALLLIFILTLLFNVFRNRYRLYRIVCLPARECVLRYYDYYISVLGLQGYGLKPSETAFQYSERIDSSLYFKSVKFKEITDVFVRSRYSQKEISENEKQLLCDFQEGFIDEMKGTMGKIKFFLLKYVLGKF
jgi:transglutaminase-like putative cysteine protease